MYREREFIHGQFVGAPAQCHQIINNRSIKVPPVLSHANASPRTSEQSWRDGARQGDQEMANFDLRAALADITVRETSFSEFLAALKLAGRKPL